MLEGGWLVTIQFGRITFTFSTTKVEKGRWFTAKCELKIRDIRVININSFNNENSAFFFSIQIIRH